MQLPEGLILAPKWLVEMMAEMSRPGSDPKTAQQTRLLQKLITRPTRAGMRMAHSKRQTKPLPKR